jgi:hypothetical protein
MTSYPEFGLAAQPLSGRGFDHPSSDRNKIRRTRNAHFNGRLLGRRSYAHLVVVTQKSSSENN